MSLVALTNFITITKPNGSVSFTPTKFQNGKYNEIVDGHSYLSFLYQGATRSRSGDNLESSLILANNAIRNGIETRSLSGVENRVIEFEKLSASFVEVSDKMSDEAAEGTENPKSEEDEDLTPF